MTMTSKQIQDIYQQCLAYEISPKNPPDGRRVISQERMRLGEALQRSDGAAIHAHAAEAARTLDLWKNVA